LYGRGFHINNLTHEKDKKFKELFMMLLDYIKHVTNHCNLR